MRRQQIQDLYLSLLQRNADESGLNHYLNSNLSIDQIKMQLLNSVEYKLLSSEHEVNNDSNYEVLELFNSNSIKVDYYKNVNPSDKVIITFRGYEPYKSLDGFGLFGKKVSSFGYDIICFKTQNINFYSTIDQGVYDKIAKIIKQYKFKFGIGISMGTYPLVNNSKLLKLDKVYCLSARRQFFKDPKPISEYPVYDLDNDKIDDDCDYYFFTNPNHPYDFIDLIYFLKKMNSKKIEIYDIHDSEKIHVPTETLYANGLYNEFIKTLFVDGDILKHHTIVKRQGIE